MKSSRLHGCAAAALSLATLSPTSAIAQDAPATAEEAVSPGGIVVTARRREERLIDVPDAITAFGSAQIEQAGIGNVNDIAIRVPNFSIVEAQQPGVAAINIRGVGQVRNGEPPVAVIVDGVQLSSAYQITQDLFDVERIEVIKGPQGASYGRNAIGGAINIITRRPTNAFEGWAQLGYATGDAFSLSGAFSGPVVEDRLLFRVSGSVRDADGDISNVTLGRPVNFEETVNLRGQLLARIAEGVEVDLRYSRLDTESGAAWYTLVPPGTSVNEVLPVSADRLGRAERVLDDVSAKLEVALGGLTLTSVTAFSKVFSDLDEDFDFTPLDLLSATQTLHQKSWSEELRLASDESGRLNWLVGGYYLSTDQDIDNRIFIRPGASGILVPFPVPAPTVFTTSQASSDNRSYALFGQLTYRFGARFELSLGARQDWDERTQLDRVTLEQRERSFRAFQPKAQFSYRPNANTNLYASAGRGFRSGGFNANARITRSFDAETNWNYEVGAKLRVLDGALQLNGAAFITDISDRQVYIFDLLTAAQVIANPIESARIRGLEIEATARPARGLSLSASLGLLDSEIRRYDSSVFAGLPVSGDFTGNKLPQTAHASYSLSAQYDVDLSADAGLGLRAEYNSSGGDYFWEIDNLDRRERIDLVSLRLSARWQRATLTGYVENLFGEDYVLEYISQAWSGAPLGNYSSPAWGRRWGLQLRYRF
jgi:Outer membrane receptor proteins, mostly Fe transport